MGSLAIDFSDKPVFVVENIKIPDYCSLFTLGLNKTKTQFGMWSASNTLLYASMRGTWLAGQRGYVESDTGV